MRDLDPLLLDRWLAGEPSPADRAAVQAWAAADPRHAALLAALEARHRAPAAVDTDAAWARLAARLDAPAGVVPIAARRAAPRPRAVRWRTAAAAAVLVVGAALGARALGPFGETVVAAPAGERLAYALPDGTTLTLAPGATLRVPRRYGTGTGRGARDVTLDGEAYFAVVHDAARPFRVHARGGVAEDVGTRFVVRAWPELPQLEVAVTEGAVALGRRGTVLRAGQRGRLRADGAVDVAAADTAVATAWTRGVLALADAPLAEALPAIGRWYGVTLRADPALAARRLTARFAAEPLPQALDALGVALGARLERAGDTITLRPLAP